MPTPESLNQAFEDAVAALLPDLPYLMHGAGDVPPEQVDPATAHLVTQLTVQYMAKLCDAAVDAHEILRDNSRNNDSITPCLPPPGFYRPRHPPKPQEKGIQPPLAALPERKRRARDEYWDEQGQNCNSVVTMEEIETESVHIDEWVGLAGVDFLENRARTAYVQGPAVLSTQSFLFPICHDVYTYGRVRQLQAARRSILPLLMNPVFNELVQQEGKQEHAHVKSAAKKKGGTSGGTIGDASDPEEDEQEEEAAADEEDLPFWPGLDDVVPAHRSNDNTSQL